MSAAPVPFEEVAEIATGAIVLSPFGKRLGLEPVLMEPDHVVVRLPFAEENVTIGDVVHGGAIAGLVDVAATAAAWSGSDDPLKKRGTTIGISLSYLNAAHGTSLRADARVRRRGRSVCFIDVTVSGEDGVQVASAQVTYKLSEVAKANRAEPTEALAKLFEGRPAPEQKAILAQLERAGAMLYEQWAKQATDEAEQHSLMEAARREIANAETLEQRT